MGIAEDGCESYGVIESILVKRYESHMVMF